MLISQSLTILILLRLLSKNDISREHELRNQYAIQHKAKYVKKNNNNIQLSVLNSKYDHKESFAKKNAMLLVPYQKYLNEALRTADNNATEPIYLEGMGYKAPSFLIIGTQKGGTSTLGFMLQHHPNVTRSSYKELHFFNGNLFHPMDGFVPLLEKFPNLKLHNNLAYSEHKMISDSTPLYMLLTHKIPIIRKMCPWIKVIALLRNPVDRLFSHYAMTCKYQRLYCSKNLETYIQKDLDHLIEVGLVSNDTDSIKMSVEEQEEAWSQYINSKASKRHILIGRGLYSIQLRQWLKYFPRESVLVMKYEDMKKEEGLFSMINRTLAFLELPSVKKTHFQKFPKVINKGSYVNVSPMSKEIRDYLTKIYRPYNRELVSLLGSEWANVWE